MTKDEALDLALAALECFDYPAHDDDVNKIQAAITAIKQARSAPVQEPVGYVAENGVVDWNVCAPPILTDLYTTPPAAQRQWVGLTNKEIYDCEPKKDWYDSVEFAQAIEAKLKEKNT